MMLFEVDGVLYALNPVRPPEMTWEQLMDFIEEANNDFDRLG